MKSVKLNKIGSQGSVFYKTKNHQTIRNKMHPTSQKPEEIVINQWESVTYSPEEIYIKLEKKRHKSTLSKTKKPKLTFSEMANQYSNQ
ncbi:hypothetical protein DID74_02580 [Candidatus Marinamargulisbacteria bacterium SCGC AG-333-B06]|nr:hypothetical protein DID74_02580 [Candidatus Marinamargulisbacteria bacterium SCGC AG-333-B06]